MAIPYMTKDRVRDTMTIIESLAHCLKAFIDSDGDDFYDKIEYSTSAPEEDREEGEREDMIDKMIKYNVVMLDLFNNEVIPYLRSQPESYIAFLRTELIPSVLPAMKAVLEQDGVENKIYRYEDSDFMHDVYLVLNWRKRLN